MAAAKTPCCLGGVPVTVTGRRGLPARADWWSYVHHINVKETTLAPRLPAS